VRFTPKAVPISAIPVLAYFTLSIVPLSSIGSQQWHNLPRLSRIITFFQLLICENSYHSWHKMINNTQGGDYHAVFSLKTEEILAES
jgi:hypothetical protein